MSEAFAVTHVNRFSLYEETAHEFIEIRQPCAADRKMLTQGVQPMAPAFRSTSAISSFSASRSFLRSSVAASLAGVISDSMR
ncbi:hypothetical protein C8N35_110131 [Breoghania corrubedonensis]|uniref:Uncharacterized protein n=1 Tax=Breoghania corrubedonensis TaxID=665038 RepID=A0A2T5V1N4_9HYPH|nr:hypothetical protein C8N35_110131 [Breoghania corrubedonensis]